MILRFLLACFAAVLFNAPAAAQEREGGYLYHVATTRAAPGKLEDLLKWIEEINASGFLEDSGVHKTLIMRHSQGYLSGQWKAGRRFIPKKPRKSAKRDMQNTPNFWRAAPI